MVGINSLPVFVLLGLSVGRALYPSNHFVSALLPRQDDFVDDLACGPLCEPGVCGTGSCAFDSITPEAFRDFSPQNISEVRPPIFGGHKSGIKSGGGNKTLSRRVFRYGFTSNNYNGKKPTVGEADYYLPQVLLHDRENDYFGNADGFFVADSQAAVMNQRQFGDEPFQFGTNGLHGCTMVTIVSRRAVWMAHFWEVFSHSGKYGVEPNDITYMGFRERILDVIRDIPVTNPVNPPGGKVYEPPVGPRIDPNLFNRPDDGTQILLYVPNPMGSMGAEKAAQRYAERNAQMIDALRERVGGDPVVKTFIYNALYYDDPADKALSRTTRRGMALFQYDPNSNKKRKRAWRLLYENGFYSGVIQ